MLSSKYKELEEGWKKARARTDFIVHTYGLKVPGNQNKASHHVGSVGEGWTGILRDLVQALIKAGWNKELHQIKEKFGGLCFYTGTLTDEQAKLVSQAETQALITCEYCGVKKSNTVEVCLRGKSWVKTCCYSCAKKEGIE